MSAENPDRQGGPHQGTLIPHVWEVKLRASSVRPFREGFA